MAKSTKAKRERKPSQRLTEALLILRDKRPYNASKFAEMFWPDSNMHTLHSRGGRGTQRGKAAWLCAGSYLGKLRRSGLVIVNYSFERRMDAPIAYLTAKGDAILAEYEREKASQNN